MGDRRDLNPQPPVPQTGALPLRHDHQWKKNTYYIRNYIQSAAICYTK